MNKVSLEVCLRWAKSANSTGFQSRTFLGVKHLDMVTDEDVLKAIEAIVDPQSGSAIARVNI